LLQLSGIGPSEVLRNAGIKPVFINENVGKHLQNHPLIFIALLANPALSGIPPGAPYAFTINSVYLPVVGGSASDPRMLQILFEYVPAGPQVPVPLVVMGFELLNPLSEGSVNIQSDNPFQIAAADDGFYQNPVDLENMKNAVQVYIKNLLTQLAAFGFIAVPGDPIYSVVLQGFSDDSVRSYVKNNSNLSLDVQATLLRVIQERKFKRVGGNKETNVDVRLIVASNENLQDAYRKGKFREDLYHRFNEFSIKLPALRNRQEDILHFANFFLAKTTAELDKDVPGFEDGVLQTFLQYTWPGNLREFRNVVRRAVLLTPPGEKINSSSLPWEINNTDPIAGNGHDIKTITAHPAMPKKELDLKDAASRAEYETIMAVLQQVNFNKKKAAEMLNIDRKTLYNKIKNFQE